MRLPLVGIMLYFAGSAFAGPREEVARIATTLLETKEDWGENSGPMVDQILASVDLPPGNPWCAAFNYYCFSRAGFADAVPRTGWSPSWLAGQKKPADKAQTADVFGIYFSSLRRIAHTGIIEKPCKGYCITIEGNTNNGGSRDGDGVYRRRRPNKTIVIKDWLEEAVSR
jgi:hypothetical protein